jgi:energy-coupling factor transport system ATP-binding protein
LALQPRIFVFDEPTTDLDPLGKLEIFAVLSALRREGYTLIVIEHEIAAAEQADRLIVLSGGRIVCDDNAAKVLGRAAFLNAHGIRPPDRSRIAEAFQLTPLPGTLDATEVAVRALTGNVRVDDQATPAPSLLRHDEPALIEAEDISFEYDSGTPALKGVSLRLPAGEFVAVIGQNGSGKTTLAKHLNGLLRPTAGRVALSGSDLSTLAMSRVAAEVGYVFQNPDHQIFAATVAEEVAFGPRNFGRAGAELTERIGEVLEAVGMRGLDDVDPFLLAKGQRQRLAVASILVMRPRLLILDEPTTGLDYDEQRRMMDLLARLHAQGLGVLIITHSPWVVAEYAKRGVLMSGGRILFDGPLRSLLAEETLLAQAHFQAPEVTRLGRRFGFTPLSVDEFTQQLRAAC